MNPRSNPTESREHRNAQRHLAWYAIGRLDAREQARVGMHVANCPACQADLALDAALTASAPAAPLSVDAGWSRLLDRLDAERRRPLRPAHRRLMHLPAACFGDWRGWAIAAQFVLIVLLGILLANARPATGYQVLGRPHPAPAGDLLVMFSPSTTEGSMRDLLSRSGARVVDGPTVTGAYVLQIEDGGERAALSRLRGSAAVTLAEPLGPEAQP